MGKREPIALFVSLVSCDCCVALPHDTKGLSVEVCDCGIFCSYSLTIFGRDLLGVASIVNTYMYQIQCIFIICLPYNVYKPM